MRKASKIIAMCVALIAAFSLCAFSASAATVDITYLFTLSEAYTKDTNGEWHKKTDATWTYDSSTSEARMVAAFGFDLANTPYTGFRLKFGGRPNQNNLLISAGYYAVMTISVRDNYLTGDTSVGERYCNVAIYDDLGNTYTIRTSPVYTTYTENGVSYYNWNVSLVGQIGSGDRAYIQNMVIESNMPSGNLGNDEYNVSMRFQIAETATEAQRMHEEQLKAIEDAATDVTGAINDATTDITSAIGDAATDITNAIGDATDEIVNGWEVPSDGDPAGDMDSMTDDMGDAESEALGGKTDDEIQNELGGLLSSNNLPSVGSSGMVSGIFNKLLTAFGNEYQAVLMLSLVLGLAAFLVGRSYRAKGD